MKYRSTRGKHVDYSFEQTVLTGLAPDGGLFIPHSIPTLPDDWQTSWRDLTFQQLALEIFSLYISPDEITQEELKGLISCSYSSFRAFDVTPVVKIKENLYILELFHGPTFAFKDVALQFLGNLFEFFLSRRNAHLPPTAKPQTITVVGATSGDTGSAAIYGLRGKRNVSVFILHPRGKVSPIQEAQMTTVLDANVHNVAVEGTFDDCQDMVKQLFADTDFNARHSLGAVNSINWARILAQVVYYFHSYFVIARQSSSSSSSPISYTVPTGNFGDVLAGYYAYRMGLPTSRLIIATNENDILDRFFRSNGIMERQVVSDVAGEVRETFAPAMDITVSSNFERLLWHLAYDEAVASAECARDDNAAAQKAGTTVTGWMRELKEKGGFTVPSTMVDSARSIFDSTRVSDEQILQTIRAYYQLNNYVLDPHTAIGITAADRLHPDGITISLATAHPAKFSAAVEKALYGISSFNFKDILPSEFVGILEREKRVVVIPEPKVELVKDVIERKLNEN